MNHFRNKLKTGAAIGAQKTFAEDFNKVLEILEHMEGICGVTLTKKGTDWRFSLSGEGVSSGGGGGGGGGIPAGYEEETLNVVTDGKIVTRTVLVKTATKSDVETWGSSDQYLMLRVGYDGKLRAGRASFKEGS